MSEKSRSEQCYCHCHQQHHLCCNREWHGTPYCSKAAAEHVVMLVCHREARQKPEQDEVDFRRHLILRAIKPMSGLGDSIRGCAMHPSGILTLPLWGTNTHPRLPLALSCRYCWMRPFLLGCLPARNPALLKSFRNSSKVLFPFFLNPSKERCNQPCQPLLPTAVAAMKALWKGAEIKPQSNSSIQRPSFPPHFHSFHHRFPSFPSPSYYVGMCGDGANDCGVCRDKSLTLPFISLLSTYGVKVWGTAWHTTSQAFPKLAHGYAQWACCYKTLPMCIFPLETRTDTLLLIHLLKCKFEDLNDQNNYYTVYYITTALAGLV